MQKKKTGSSKKDTKAPVKQDRDDLLVNELIKKRKLQQAALTKIISSMDKIKNLPKADKNLKISSRKKLN